jgi:hypothetical protein
VNLGDAVGVEAGLLEGAIDVGRVDGGVVVNALGPAAEDRKALVRRGGSVEVHAVTVEAPGHRRVGVEPGRVGHLRERQAEVGVGRVRLPESLVAAEVGQARIDAHAGPCAEDQRVRLGDGEGGAL